MGNSIGISAPDHTPDSIFGPDACATIISLHMGVCWKLLLAAFLLEKSNQQTVLSGTCTIWRGDFLEPVARGLGLSTSSGLG